MLNRSAYCSILWCAASAMVALVGCGPSGPERVTVTGTVTFDGEKVGFGRIFFVPIDGTKGSGSGGQIKYGEYRLDAKGGVPVGTYTVRIDAYELAPGQEPPGQIVGLDYKIGRQYLPEKYNHQSELRQTLDPGDSEVEADFELSSK